MTAIISQPLGGILLNPRSALSTSWPSSTFASPFPNSPPRKIRFAPLPDPRRDNFPPVFDQDDSDSDPPAQHPRHSASAPPIFSSPSPANSNTSLQDLDQHSDDPALRAKLKNKKWGQKLLRPLLQPLLPSIATKSNDEDPLSAPDSAPEYKAGAPLGRFMSTGGIITTKESERSHDFRDGAPLTHTSSATGPPGSKGRKDGQRMLNGRIYGKRNPVDPNKALSEPEFVEWGYGGMGSVNNDHPRGRGSTASLDWAKVQSRAGTFGHPQSGDPDLDDGSGMGWVRKRREKREREKREREEYDKIQKERGLTDPDTHPEELLKPPQDHSIPRKTDPDADIHRRGDEHHIYRAVSVPAPHHHHHPRHSSHHKGGNVSGTHTPASTSSLSRSSSAGSAPKVKQTDDRLNSVPKTDDEATAGSGVNSLASKTSSDSLKDENDDDDSTEQESDDDEDDAEEESRITSKSAGVEKISRHME